MVLLWAWRRLLIADLYAPKIHVILVWMYVHVWTNVSRAVTTTATSSTSSTRVCRPWQSSTPPCSSPPRGAAPRIYMQTRSEKTCTRYDACLCVMWRDVMECCSVMGGDGGGYSGRWWLAVGWYVYCFVPYIFAVYACSSLLVTHHCINAFLYSLYRRCVESRVEIILLSNTIWFIYTTISHLLITLPFIHSSNHILHSSIVHPQNKQSEYLQRKSLGSTTDLLDHFDQLNTQLSAHDLEHWGYSGRSDQNAKLNAIKKATKFKFFLGLSKRWLHE